MRHQKQLNEKFIEQKVANEQKPLTNAKKQVLDD